jgi:tetratricopeptide (TPR) repeat protein
MLHRLGNGSQLCYSPLVLRALPLIVAALSVVAAPSALLSQEPSHAHGGEGHRLGTVDFPNSGAPAAQESFLRGIAFLHSFEYTDAAEAFREAQAVDPDFALAFWGEALTNTQLLWGVDDPDAARQALGRLAASPEDRLALAGTEFERAFGAAVEAFFAEDETTTRARAFADSLRGLAARDPAPEAAAFASLAIQMALAEGAYPQAERTSLREEAIALADRVFRANPDHPGAAHYLIHAYDDPELAPRGLEAARAYASIAPDAEHALHMPSHIFLQVGLWDDTASSNERAWAASRAWVARRGASGADHDFHSLQWLQYAYLQQGRHDMAAALVDSARSVLAGVELESGSYPDAVYIVPRLEFALAAETGNWTAWNPPAAPEPASGGSARQRFFALNAMYQRGAGSAMRGDAAAAEEAARAVRQVAEELPDGAPGAGSVELAAMQLEALAAGARGDHEAMLAGLEAAARASDALPPPVGPPSSLPTQELLGNALLEAGRPAEAVVAFERALELRPNRSTTLLGLARARSATGDLAGAAAAYRELHANWHAADPALEALPEVRSEAGETAEPPAATSPAPSTP